MKIPNFGEHQRSMAHGSIDANPFMASADLATAKVLQEFSNVTLFVHGAIQSLLGYQAIEASLVILNTMRYGNFQRAILVLVVPRGKKKQRRYVETTHASTVIVQGWNLSSLPPEHDGSGMSRHTGFDAEWDHDFAMWLEDHRQNSGFRVLADLRNHDSKPVKTPLPVQLAAPSRPPSSGVILPTTAVPADSFRLTEGAAADTTQTRYERNPEARARCLAHYGLDCQTCGMNFVEKYGDLGRGFIHVHHLTPLADDGQEHEVDPVQDLRPVCPNCHAMLHRRNPPLAIAELRTLLTST